MVEMINGFVVDLELLLNVNLIVGTTFLINGHGQLQQIGITLIIESILLF